MAFDVIVIGSGGSGLTAALVSAIRGSRVLVVEASDQLGGTTAISGGNLWVPCNPAMQREGHADDLKSAFRYLQRVTMGRVDEGILRVLLDKGPDFVAFLERETRLTFKVLNRPDYQPHFEGASPGRGLEVDPVIVDLPRSLGALLRSSPTRGPITFAEGRAGVPAELIDERRGQGARTQGAGLIAGLVEACAARGVEFRTRTRVRSLFLNHGRVSGCSVDGPSSAPIEARASVVVATGGFEWNSELLHAFVPGPLAAPLSPPFANGDGLLMGLSVGASIANMTEAWWTAALSIPFETYDGASMTRNIVRELALPGSILVNSLGARFVNEAIGYNELGKAFLIFDPVSQTYPNERSWMVFDETFRRSYPAATIAPNAPDPDWFVKAPTLPALAAAIEVPVEALERTVSEFNRDAEIGKDSRFGRGDTEHHRFNGDPTRPLNPCLGVISNAPFYAVKIRVGINGTKGGLRTDAGGRVLNWAGDAIAGFFGVGDVAASIMGPGYPGAGGSLGPAMTMAYIAGGMASHLPDQPRP